MRHGNWSKSESILRATENLSLKQTLRLRNLRYSRQRKYQTPHFSHESTEREEDSNLVSHTIDLIWTAAQFFAFINFTPNLYLSASNASEGKAETLQAGEGKGSCFDSFTL